MTDKIDYIEFPSTNRATFDNPVMRPSLRKPMRARR